MVHILALCLFLTSILTAMESEEVSVCVFGFSERGKRTTQEDIYSVLTLQNSHKIYDVCCVADGHSGEGVALLAKDMFFSFFQHKMLQNSSVKDALYYACEQCEEVAKSEKHCGAGSTLLATCFERDTGVLSTVWLGDSRLFADEEFMTEEHNCSNEQEKERVLAAGGKISDGKLSGKIEVTRSLGDAFAKSKISQLIFEPEYKEKNIYKNYGNGEVAKYAYLIHATDGFWGVVKREDVSEYLWDAKKLSHEDFYQKYPNKFGVTKCSADDNELASSSSDNEDNTTSESEYSDSGSNYIARRLVYIAISHLGSKDNTTVVVTLVGRDPWLTSESDSDSVDPDLKRRQEIDYSKLVEALNKLKDGENVSQDIGSNTENSQYTVVNSEYNADSSGSSSNTNDEELQKKDVKSDASENGVWSSLVATCLNTCSAYKNYIAIGSGVLVAAIVTHCYYKYVQLHRIAG